MRPFSLFIPARGRPLVGAAGTALVFALALSTNAGASDRGLRTTLDAWSRMVGADARSVALAAQHRHPRRMTSSAVRFRTDALRARAAVAAERPTTARASNARRLALRAFADYASAGSGWAATGQARLQHQAAVASRYARIATASARVGSRLLVAAARLLR